MTLGEWLGRLWGTVRRRRTDRDLEDELRLHLELPAEDARRRGSSIDDAARAARLQAGGIAQAMEAMRDQRGLPWLEDLARDLSYGCRMLARNPAFAIVAVLSLAMGIGANTAIFSFADGLLLRPLTVPRPSEVVTVGSSATATMRSVLLSSFRDYVDIRDRTRSFDGLVAYAESVVGFSADQNGSPRLTMGMLVTGNFFPVMEITPELGRVFRPEEDQVPGRDAVVILGHSFWQREFGGDRAIVGRTIRLDGAEFTVIGVTPASFTGMDQYIRYDFFAPIMMWPRLIADPKLRPLESRDTRLVNIRGRLKRGVTITEAQTELAVIGRDLERAYPDTNRNQVVTARTELQARIAAAPALAPFLLMLTVLAGAVLFVACANVAGLLASRAPVRGREIAMRLAIGAGRARIVRQLITESLLIAIAGGVLGLAVGYAGVAVFRQVRIPTDLPIATSFQLDRRALATSAIVALISAVLFGVAPAIRSTRTDLTAVMKASDATGFGRRRRWGRALLVGGQVAVAVVLLVTATFVHRAFRQRLAAGPGHRIDHVLMMGFAPSAQRYTDAEAQRFFDQVVERARAAPGVRSAALTSFVPMDGLPRAVTVVPEGYQFPAGTDSAKISSAMVDEAYFDTMQLSIVSGRALRPTDTADAPPVAVVNDQFAQHYWGGQNPLGKRFRVSDASSSWVQIVGVVKTTKYATLTEKPTDFIFFPFRQRLPRVMVLLAESHGDPADLAAPLREVVRRLDPDQAVNNVRTMEDHYRMRVVGVFNVIVTSVAALGIMGLGLSIIGLYGLVAYAASRRTREIGIRMAIGADRADILRMVLRQGMVLAVAGLAVGLLASAGGERTLAAVLPGGAAGTGRNDFVPFLLVAAAVLAVTLLAAYLPARRASRVNPTEALRYD